jgi:hypothetical protein
MPQESCDNDAQLPWASEVCTQTKQDVVIVRMMSQYREAASYIWYVCGISNSLADHLCVFVSGCSISYLICRLMCGASFVVSTWQHHLVRNLLFDARPRSAIVQHLTTLTGRPIHKKPSYVQRHSKRCTARNKERKIAKHEGPGLSSSPPKNE